MKMHGQHALLAIALRATIGPGVLLIVIAVWFCLQLIGGDTESRFVSAGGILIGNGQYIIGAFGAALLAGFARGVLRTPISWLVLSVLFLPVHWFLFFVVCGFGESGDCRRFASPVFCSGLLTVAFILPIVALNWLGNVGKRSTTDSKGSGE